MSDYIRVQGSTGSSIEPTIGPAPTLADGRQMSIQVNEKTGVLSSRDGGRTVRRDERADWTPSKQPTPLYGGRNTLGGAPITDPAQINQYSVFEVSGISMTVENMVDAGLLVKTAGGYELPQSPDADERPAAEQKPAEEEFFESLSPEAAEVFDRLDSITGDSNATERIAFTTISSVLHGKPEVAIADVAHRFGISREEAGPLVAETLANVTAHVAEKITHTYHDVNGSEVLDWAAANVRPGELTEIAFNLARGDKKTLTAIVERYRKSRFVKAAGEGNVAGFERIS